MEGRQRMVEKEARFVTGDGWNRQLHGSSDLYQHQMKNKFPGTTKSNSAVCLQYTFLSSWQCPTSSSAGIKEKSPPTLRAELHPSARNGLHLVESMAKGGFIDLTLNITGFARATDGKALLLKMTLMSLNVDKLSWYPTRTGPLLTGTHCIVSYSAHYWRRQVTVNITQLQLCHL